MTESAPQQQPSRDGDEPLGFASPRVAWSPELRSASVDAAARRQTVSLQRAEALLDGEADPYFIIDDNAAGLTASRRRNASPMRELSLLTPALIGLMVLTVLTFTRGGQLWWLTALAWLVGLGAVSLRLRWLKAQVSQAGNA